MNAPATQHKCFFAHQAASGEDAARLSDGWEYSSVLKEWASVVAALSAGEQIILLRKGGIQEKGFKAASSRRCCRKHKRLPPFCIAQLLWRIRRCAKQSGSSRFALYPTAFHNVKSLLQPWAERFSDVPASTPGAPATPAAL